MVSLVAVNWLQSKMLVAMVATGIDFLAAGIGNIHGPYPANWEGLDLDHLRKLTEAVPGFPIVLHGGSGIPDEQIQAAIKLGCC
jgi:fructose-bisphosphate aldolase class II